MNDIATEFKQFLLKGEWKKSLSMGGQAEFTSADGELQVVIDAPNVWRLGRFTDTDVDGVATGLFETIAEGDTFVCLLDAITAAIEKPTCGTCDCTILPDESWETFGDVPYHHNPNDCVAAIREQHRIELSEMQTQRDELYAALASIRAHHIRPTCRRSDHKPFRFPLCADCQLDARIKDADTALVNARKEESADAT